MAANCDGILDRFMKSRQPEDYMKYALCVSMCACPIETAE
ncbi:unnamed protein product, partial [Heterosigma akashiwo]